MQIPRKYIENYSNTLNVVSEQARKKLADALSQIDYSADVATIRETVIAIMQPACNASTQVAAKLAAEFYDGLRERFGISDDFEAQPESLRIPAATDGAVRAFAQDLVEDKPLGDFIGKCVDRIDYETRRAANECAAYNAKQDPKKPKWARVPTGAETCMWCIMLASRGFAYLSEEAASHSHAHCDCRIVPSWDKKNPAVQGYDPALYYDMWKHPEKYKDKVGDEQQKVELKTIEASQYPDKFTNTKGKLQNFETFADAVNAVEGADPKMREIFSRVGEIANSPHMPAESFDVKYTAGRGTVSYYSSRSTGEVTKLTVNVPKMTSDNIRGTISTTCHELGHFIDLMKGESATRWLSSKHSGFLATDYMSLPPSERRAAVAARREQVTPKGQILEVMRGADERYKAAVESVKSWYKEEYERIDSEYQSIENKTIEDRKQNLKQYKTLRREYDKKMDVECRIAMDGVDKLEDIYDALNDGYLRGKKIDGVDIHYGHGDSYYRTRSKQVEEIWANYCALSLTRPDLIDLLRQDQPRLIESMDAMRDEILGGLNG